MTEAPFSAWDVWIPRQQMSQAQWQADMRPLIVHVIHRLQVGGLENGLVNLINRLPAECYRHAIVCLTDYTDFARRIETPDVPVFALHKRAGKDPASYLRLWRLLRRLRPALVHTRNLATLEAAVVASLAGVPCRIHGEHGRDVQDLDGSNRKYNALRRFCRHFVQHYITVSRDLAQWLQSSIAVPGEKISPICNGVDADKFHPLDEIHPLARDFPFGAEDWVIGTVGRMETVKNQTSLARAFIRLCADSRLRQRARLVLVGEGSLLPEVRRLLEQAGLLENCWLPGKRDDIASIMRGLDVFVLPSLAEGISNTILEAMASGLPVVATHTGGNPELVRQERTGLLVPVNDDAALAHALRRYVEDAGLQARHGQAARDTIEKNYSLACMVTNYHRVYARCLERAGIRKET